MEEELDSLEPFPEEALRLNEVSDKEPHKNAARLQAVHHSYRKVERTKRFYHIDTESLMRRQQALLDNLKSENVSLQEMVDTYVIEDYGKQMALSLEEANRYTGLIESESKKLHNLEASVHNLDAKELDCKRQMGGYMAGWTKHRTTQIHIQQDENRLHKTTVDNNIVKGHMKMLKGKMTQLREEQNFYNNVHQKLNKELHEVEQDIQQCIANMEGMYADRNEYQEEISDLVEMADSKHNYSQWLTMEGWATQEPFALSELSSSALAASATKNEDNSEKDSTNDGAKEKALNEMEGLDSIKQDHIFDKSAVDGDVKSNVAARRYEVDQAVDFLLDSIRHLQIDDEAFIPIGIDMKKQIILVFKEAGCYIKEDEYPELTVGKFFSKLEDFVDRISGTFN